MKGIRFGLVSVLLLAALSSAALADEKTEAKSAKGGGKSAEQKADKAMAKWEDTLKLTADQKPQFEQVMKDSYQKMADAKKDAGGEKAKMKASMQTIMADRAAALSKILTPDQMKIYNEKMEKMGSEAKKHWDKDAKEDAKEGKK
jgi:Spy/CpxP family protein refolding chaperone